VVVLFYLAGKNKFIFAISVAEKDTAAFAWGNFHVQAIFFPFEQLRLIWRPRQVVGLDGVEFVAGAPSPHTFARLRSAYPVIQISLPSCLCNIIM
jgi:hypothetical protein